MQYKIGMIGASGTGKTSLMTAMFSDMTLFLEVNRQSVGDIVIQANNMATKTSIKDSIRRFNDCVQLGQFIAWERSSECSNYGFRLDFTHGGLSKSFNFQIMDYPGGLLSDPAVFQEQCLPFISQCCALFVPVDAVALLKYDDMKSASPKIAEKILDKLAIPRCVEIIKTWSEMKTTESNRMLFLVPVKTESFFSDSGCCTNACETRIEDLMRSLYCNKILESCPAGTFQIIYNPVDTYGCVQLESAEWEQERNSEKGYLKEEFAIAGKAARKITGAVDLFSLIVQHTINDKAQNSREKVAQDEAIINDRGFFSRLYYRFFPDPVQQGVEDNKNAVDFYGKALIAISKFSSTSRIKKFN